MSAVWTPANPPAEARIPCIQANSNRSPRFLHIPRRPANTGENPGEHWASRDAVRTRSLLFDGFGDRRVAAEGVLRSFCGRLCWPQTATASVVVLVVLASI
jgi:hypothetical protein